MLVSGAGLRVPANAIASGSINNDRDVGVHRRCCTALAESEMRLLWVAEVCFEHEVSQAQPVQAREAEESTTFATGRNTTTGCAAGAI